MKGSHWLVMPMVLFALPAVAEAQVCVGSPVHDGGSAVAVGAAFPENATSYGVTFRSNPMGPLSGSVGYAMTDIDNADPKMHTMAGQIEYALPISNLSSCVVAGAGYSRVSQDGSSMSFFDIPVGVGVGYEVEASAGLALIPFAVPQLVWSRVSFNPDAGDSVSDSETGIGATVGVTAATRQFFVGGALSTVKFENVDATNVFSVNVGFMF